MLCNIATTLSRINGSINWTSKMIMSLFLLIFTIWMNLIIFYVFFLSSSRRKEKWNSLRLAVEKFGCHFTGRLAENCGGKMELKFASSKPATNSHTTESYSVFRHCRQGPRAPNEQWASSVEPNPPDSCNQLGQIAQPTGCWTTRNAIVLNNDNNWKPTRSH